MTNNCQMFLVSYNKPLYCSWRDVQVNPTPQFGESSCLWSWFIHLVGGQCPRPLAFCCEWVLVWNGKTLKKCCTRWVRNQNVNTHQSSVVLCTLMSNSFWAVSVSATSTFFGHPFTSVSKHFTHWSFFEPVIMKHYKVSWVVTFLSVDWSYFCNIHIIVITAKKNNKKAKQNNNKCTEREVSLKRSVHQADPLF